MTLFLKNIDKIFLNLSQIIDIKPVTIEQLKTATKWSQPIKQPDFVTLQSKTVKKKQTWLTLNKLL